MRRKNECKSKQVQVQVQTQNAAFFGGIFFSMTSSNDFQEEIAAYECIYSAFTTAS
ncbi:MAG: hypothetical protein GY822_01865 [Deltaproteobacteria bacterium]|nr:hypothetical protein [Deltaproteobacteria bacterium]